MIRSLNVIALSIVVPTVLAIATANAQQQAPPKPRGPVTAYVVMTPSGPATCATWVQWRGPGAHPTDKAAIQYWAEGYISGLAAGSRNDVLVAFASKISAPGWIAIVPPIPKQNYRRR